MTYPDKGSEDDQSFYSKSTTSVHSADGKMNDAYFFEIQNTLQTLRSHLAQCQCTEIKSSHNVSEAESYSSTKISQIPSEFLIFFHSQQSNNSFPKAQHNSVSTSIAGGAESNNRTSSVAIVSPSTEFNVDSRNSTRHRNEDHQFSSTILSPNVLNTNFETSNFIPVVSEEKNIECFISPSQIKIDRNGCENNINMPSTH